MTLIFTANQTMTNPPPGTPTLPDTATGLAFDFSFDGLKATTVDGGAVNSISSAGSSALTLSTKITEYRYPTLTHAGPKGHAFLHFGGNQMISTPESGNVLSEGQSATIALVVRAEAGATTQRILGVATNANGYRFISPAAGGFIAQGQDSAGPGSLSGNGALNNWHVVIATYAGANSRLQVNGSDPVTGSLPRGEMRGLRLGRTGSSAVSPASDFTGDIARVMIYRRALTVSDASGLAYELMTQYGI